eukprot:15216112-Alexandrium_andersonii.AAC.1
MSASLVGSEMCIRDSAAASEPFQLGFCPWGSVGRLQGWLPPHPPPCSAPVSYTHLTLPTICSV